MKRKNICIRYTNWTVVNMSRTRPAGSGMVYRCSCSRYRTPSSGKLTLPGTKRRYIWPSAAAESEKDWWVTPELTRRDGTYLEVCQCSLAERQFVWRGRWHVQASEPRLHERGSRVVVSSLENGDKVPPPEDCSTCCTPSKSLSDYVTDYRLVVVTYLASYLRPSHH